MQSLSLLDKLRAGRDARTEAPVIATPSQTSPLLERLRAAKGVASTFEQIAERAGPLPTSTLAATRDPSASPVMRRGEVTWFSGVKRTEDFKRILALPRRDLDLAKDHTHLYRLPGGTLTLRPVQSAALREAVENKGLLGPISVGGGKTLILLLAARAMNAKRPVLLVKPDLKEQLIKIDFPFYSKHFRMPEHFSIVSYSQLSTAKSADILDRLEPDLIAADECHCLKSRDAARTKRFLRFMDKHPECAFLGLSGSITNKSVRDYAHLAKLALRGRSPLPMNWSDLEDWAMALDPQPEGMPDPKPGALLDFCTKGETVRQGFQRRLVQTPGVVASGNAAEGMTLRLRGLRPTIPPEVQKALDELRRSWTLGDEELEDAMALARSAKQLSQGFYYVWDWPGGKKDRDWLDARRAWHRAIRGVLQHRSAPGLDSPLLVARAAQRGLLSPDEQDAWEAWLLVKERPQPPTVPIWISDFLINSAVQDMKHGIIWYEHRAVGERIGATHGIPTFGGGTDSSKILTTKAPLIAASITAHGTGKNLQRYSHGRVLSSPSSGKTWQQLLGRQHRPGQEADEVVFDLFMHEESLENCYKRALQEAHYMEETTGDRQKILLASHENLP